MTYLPTGSDWWGGDDAASTDLIPISNFNDTRFPGVIYATNGDTHAKFVELQRQLNRGAAALSIPTRVSTDGKLGAQTLALATKVSSNSAAVSSLRNLAMNAGIVALAAKAKADAVGIPRTLTAPVPSSPPAIYNAATDSLQPAPASLSTILGGMSTTTMVALGVAAIGAGYYLTKKKRR